MTNTGRKMGTLGSAVVAIAAFAGGATAQTRAPAPAPAPAAAVSTDAARLTAARALVQTLRTEQQMRAQQAQAAADAGSAFDRFVPAQAAMRAQLTDPQGYAAARTEVVRLVAEDRQKIADETIPLMIDAEARRYAAHFTLEELRQLDAFYRSPLGQRLIAEQPKMAADSNQFQQSVLQPIVAAHSAAMGPRLAVALAPILRQASAAAPVPAAPPAKPDRKP